MLEALLALSGLVLLGLALSLTPPKPKPPPTHWSATGDGATLFSDDFVYNARLQLEGDFPSPQGRKDYAERLAERLNGGS